MIASLRGTLLERGTGGCVIEAAGVGYWVQISTTTARALPPEGSEVFLHTHLVVREDAHQIFGFYERDERRLFELLIGVSGVGPKVALAVLSGLKPGALARAIRDENLAVLVAVPGIGRKTAERLVVELRDKLELIAAAAADESAAPAGAARKVGPRSEHFEDAVAALVGLGYSPAQAQDAIRRAAEGSAADASLEDLVRGALARLTKAATTASAR
jgi:Holliday junction DNA helicase RuvA